MTALYSQDRLEAALANIQEELLKCYQLEDEEAQQKARQELQETWTVEYAAIAGLVKTSDGAGMIIENPKSLVGCLGLLELCGIDLDWPVGLMAFDDFDKLAGDLFASAATLSRAVGEHLTLLQECQEFADFESEGVGRG